MFNIVDKSVITGRSGMVVDIEDCNESTTTTNICMYHVYCCNGFQTGRTTAIYNRNRSDVFLCTNNE